MGMKGFGDQVVNKINDRLILRGDGTVVLVLGLFDFAGVSLQAHAFSLLLSLLMFILSGMR
jgi:hypothetical protein